MAEQQELQELRNLEIESDTPNETSPKSQIKILGILLAATSSLFFSLSTLIVKWLEDIHPLQLAAFRFVGILVISVPILIYNKQNPFPKGHRLMLLLRAFAGATTVSLIFYAIRHMPLADASVIVFSVPVMVAIFARIFLKEPCGLFHYFTLFLTMIGVLLITRPPFLFGQSTKQYNFLAPLAALLSTFFGAIVYILLRTLKDLHFSVIMVTFATYSIIQTTSMAWATGNLCWPKSGTEIILIVALGVFSFSASTLITIASQFEEAGLVAIARTVDVVFAFVWQIIFFDQVPCIFSIIGAVLVISSVVLIGLRKWMMSMPSTSSFRKKFGFLLL
ncbi:unnamed protein product [Macrosiphum euphorbiae]|uniref:EamA domain-containing protein n=1 Tax=Macrosiphum euphorbiae TaxID=13131 RepID=A0AAV0XKW7_9HEMI|nr:unnamed protein product [Macrosiphum euphorbiae]